MIECLEYRIMGTILGITAIILLMFLWFVVHEYVFPVWRKKKEQQK